MLSLNATAVILSGGRGTRLQSVHPSIPKPLVRVAGKPFLHWITAYLARHGIADIVYSTGYLGDQIDSWCNATEWPGVRRRTRRELVPLGTGGGLINCIDMCSEWIVVSNGDSLCLGGLTELLSFTRAGNVDAALIAARVEDASRFGSVLVADGRLVSFKEKKAGRGLMNAGVYAFRRAILERYSIDGPSSIEYDLIPSLLENDVSIGVVSVADAPFIDIGTPQTMLEADSFIAEHKYEFAQ